METVPLFTAMGHRVAKLPPAQQNEIIGSVLRMIDASQQLHDSAALTQADFQRPARHNLIRITVNAWFFYVIFKSLQRTVSPCWWQESHISRTGDPIGTTFDKVVVTNESYKMHGVPLILKASRKM